MISISFFARYRLSLEWNIYVYLCINGVCGSRGGGKNAFDLREAITLEVGHAKDEPCLAPHKWGRVI